MTLSTTGKFLFCCSENSPIRVYKCGFATTQKAYENNVFPLFKSLDRLEDIISKSSGKYLLGNELTEADIRLYVTIVRFDPVYVQHFKTNIGTIRYKYVVSLPVAVIYNDSYPRLNSWLKHLYWEVPGFKESTNFHHIKAHYMTSHVSVCSCLIFELIQINPHGIVCAGPIPHVEPL